MGDIRDPDIAEKLEWNAPLEYLRRREFLTRTAAAAGLASGLGLALRPDVLVAEAARRQRLRAVLPAPRNLPIDTFVVVMMENRSFDHYLGWLPGADGRQAGLSYTDKHGHTLQTQPLTGNFQGCGHPDPDHSWSGGRIQLDGGSCDGFLRSGSNDIFSISYYKEGDLPFIQPAAKELTVFDHFHCSLMAATLPNREYMHAAESYGQIDNNLPPQTQYQNGFPDNTIFAALSKAGVSNRYFYTDVPVAAMWGPAGLARTGQVQEYYERCQTGTLPALSFVDPNFGGSVGEGPGISGDEHPHGDVRTGQAFMSDVVHAFMESPQWKTGALFIVYDEWGGFFDHVAPPRVPDQRQSANINEDYGLMGFRIPALVVSPWARRRHVEHSTYGFESILKLICYRFGLAPLNRRVSYARNIGRSFDFASAPRLDVPQLPTPAHVVSQNCPGNANGPSAAAASRPKPHDLMDLVTSGYLERLGFHYQPSTPASTFREPHKIIHAHRSAQAHAHNHAHHAPEHAAPEQRSA
ncbi:MAG TPA: alkaline phosphatase family protein [Solirubrobacteraceae bacterium]|nr:alkaline phosphatase family protein [Solirubrobacteraceae bacterium]